MMIRHLFAYAAALALGTFLVACGARSDTDTRRFNRTAEHAASVRVERSIQDAKLMVESDAWQHLSVRYNPTHCDSPPWEALLYGAWRRIVLQPAPEASSQQMSTAWLRPIGEVFESGEGWNYPMFEWRADDENDAQRP